MKQLDEMTPKEIRLEIAERKGMEVKYPYPSIAAYIDGETPNGLDHFKPLPDWPASISAAWELVTSFIENQPWDRFDVDYNGLASTKWRASFSFIHKIYGEVADTAPLAICKAWLSWKRSEE